MIINSHFIDGASLLKCYLNVIKKYSMIDYEVLFEPNIRKSNSTRLNYIYFHNLLSNSYVSATNYARLTSSLLSNSSLAL